MSFIYPHSKNKHITNIANIIINLTFKTLLSISSFALFFIFFASNGNTNEFNPVNKITITFDILFSILSFSYIIPLF